MIVTQAEATKKLCPFAKSFNAHATRLIEVGNQNDSIGTFEYPNCVGAQCMSWEWSDLEHVQPFFALKDPGEYLVLRWVQIPERPEGMKNSNDPIAYREASKEWEQAHEDAALAAGYEIVNPGSHQTLGARYRRKLGADRKGQCGRTVLINVDRE